VKEGYSPSVVQLDAAPDDHERIAQLCQIEQAKMEAWLAADDRGPSIEFNGTLGSLIDIYATDTDSPYQDLKYSTQQSYDDDLKILKHTVGARRIAKLTGQDFRRWYNNLRKPAQVGGPERLRRAHGVMTMLRILISYGATIGVAHCDRLETVLGKMRFKTAPAREAIMTYEQAVAFIGKAHELGQPELALGQALQFEGTLRQIDIIGEWIPDPEIRGRRRWTSGLIWQDLKDYVLQKPTSKNQRAVAIDFKEYPLALAELAQAPGDRRVGPIDSKTGEPFKPGMYAKRWRSIATAAGIPSNVWNRDSRAGGVTEGSDAGATIEQMRRHASHASGTTTERYSRKTTDGNRTVARLRVAHRGKR
jgi:hypothetical protein